MSLNEALNWYHQKIGAYDKELWEKSVDRRILRGVCAIPKKITRIKTELIDVDLVQGSSFVKAKPQHSWTSATISGIKRILLMPFYYSWWKEQTCTVVSCVLSSLYALQLAAVYLYMTVDENLFSDVPATEMLTPMAMAFILSIVHSHIVTTFSAKKHAARNKKRRKHPDKIAAAIRDIRPMPRERASLCTNYECFSEVKGMIIQDQYADNNLMASSTNESGMENSDFGSREVAQSTSARKQDAGKHSSEDSLLSRKSQDSLFSESTGLESLNESCQSNNLRKSSGNQSSKEGNEKNNMHSSDEEFFVARKISAIHKETGNKEGFPEKHADCEGCFVGNNTSCKTSSILSQSYNLATSNALKLDGKNVLLKRSSNMMKDYNVSNAAVKEIKHRKKRIEKKKTAKSSINVRRSSSSNEEFQNEGTTPDTPLKPVVEWPLIVNGDSDTSDGSSQSSGISDISPSENPFAWDIQEPSKKISNVDSHASDKGSRPRSVSCTIWEQGECKKVDLSALDVSSAVIRKVDSTPLSSQYLWVGVGCALLLSALPPLFRLRGAAAVVPATDVLALGVLPDHMAVRITDLLDVAVGTHWRMRCVVMILMVERFLLGLAYFFLLSVAEKTFKQRFLYAKHFCYLTSSRRAKRSDLPHFRLNKVRNIKIWLSTRSYMKKLGPQRSVDVIVSIAFILEVCVISLLCIQLLKESGQFAEILYCWELLFWTLCLGIYLLRFMVIGTKINKKYRNLSVLITEQINLYLHMEQKPHKKEELMLANNVLKLAADLLKELESPFKISGLCANSYLYNFTKVIVLSAFSAVLTDILGFKLKLYKIKIR